MRMKKSVWRRFLILLPLLIVLVIASRVYIRSVVDTYEIRSLVMHPGVVLTSDDVRLSKKIDGKLYSRSYDIPF